MTPAERPSVEEASAELDAVIVRADLAGDPVEHLVRAFRSALLALGSVRDELAAMQARADSTALLTPELQDALVRHMGMVFRDATLSLARSHGRGELVWRGIALVLAGVLIGLAVRG